MILRGHARKQLVAKLKQRHVEGAETTHRTRVSDTLLVDRKRCSRIPGLFIFTPNLWLHMSKCHVCVVHFGSQCFQSDLPGFCHWLRNLPTPRSNMVARHGGGCLASRVGSSAPASESLACGQIQTTCTETSHVVKMSSESGWVTQSRQKCLIQV